MPQVKDKVEQSRHLTCRVQRGKIWFMDLQEMGQYTGYFQVYAGGGVYHRLSRPRGWAKM